MATGTDRANACVVAAANCYISGQGTTVSAALQAAVQADAGHRPAAAMAAVYTRNPSDLEWHDIFTQPDSLL